MSDSLLVAKIPDAYRFHFQSQSGSLTTQTIYFERHAQSADLRNDRFLGSMEFVVADTLETCFNLVHASENQKIEVFDGYIVEPKDEALFEFSTVFNTGGVGYSQHHLVDRNSTSLLFHTTLLRGFNNQDIEVIRNFGENLELDLDFEECETGEIADIVFSRDSIKDIVGQIFYLN
jgi:hypothetical protein